MRLEDVYLKVLKEQSTFFTKGKGLGSDPRLANLPPQEGKLELTDIARGDEYLSVIDIKGLKNKIKALSNCYNERSNVSMMVYGDPGMGKSAIMRDVGREICEIYNKKDGTQRQYIEYTNIVGNNDIIKDIFKNPTKYYVLITLSALTVRPHELRGVPLPPEPDLPTIMAVGLEPWMALINLDGLAGLLFLDELNQALQPTQGGLYGLLHPGERRLSDSVRIKNKNRWAVHAAGNLPDSLEGIVEFLEALKARMMRVWLEVDYPSWREWATAETTTKDGQPLIHPLIIDFLDYAHSNYRPTRFKTFFNSPAPTSEGRSGNSPSPRGFEILTDAIEGYLSAAEAEIADLTAELNNPKLSSTNRADIELKIREVQKGKIPSVIQAAKESLNEYWAEEFKRFITTDTEKVLELLSANLSDNELAKKAVQYFTPGKVGSKIPGASFRQLSMNIYAATERIKTILDVLLSRTNIITGPPNNRQLNQELFKNDELLNNYIAEARKDKEFVNEAYGVMHGLFHLFGFLKNDASQYGAIIWSALEDYEVNGIKMSQYINRLLQGESNGGLFTDKQSAALVEGKKKLFSIYTPDVIDDAKSALAIDLEQGEETREPEEENEEITDREQTTEPLVVDQNFMKAMHKFNQELDKLTATALAM